MGSVFVLFCYALLCAHSSFAIIFKRKRKPDCFAIIVLQMCYNYKCSVALLHGAVERSAVCDYAFFLIILNYVLVNIIIVIMKSFDH